MLEECEASVLVSAQGAEPRPSLADAVSQGPEIRLIGEVKRRSPSRGSMDEGLDPAERARTLVSAGAIAVSVLTEPDSFGGSDEDLRQVRSAVTCPILRKDFHVHPLQIWEARCLGASAVLLIVRALGPVDTGLLSRTANEAGIEALFEVRNEAELDWALEAGARLVGVNRRNLETLEMEPDVLERLLPRIPGNCIAIAESGITGRADVENVARFGADAVLVGSRFSTSGDVAGAASDLLGVPRVGRPT